MTKQSWYIGVTEDQVGEAAILVGDPARVDRIATHLERPVFPEEKRALRSVTGWRNGRRLTVVAYGMGAPIATIVLHELFDLGVRTFMRIGTAMVTLPAVLGDLVVAESALRNDGTSASYAPTGFPAVADFGTTAALRDRLARSPLSWHAGVFATYDGFYTQMFALDEGRRSATVELVDAMRRYRILAADMEASALMVAGRVLGARFGCLCLGTVDAMTQQKLDAQRLAAGEAELFEIALDTLATLPAPAPGTIAA
jgi:uridine phosphorylase